VSLHAVAHCDRPVVLVRATDTFGERGASQIVLGVDPRRPREELLAFAFEEAAARGLVLRAVRAWEVHQMYGSPMLDPQLDHRLRRDRHDELVGFLAPWCEAHGDVEVVPVVPPGPVALALAEEARADTALLVVGRRRRRSPAGVRVGHVTHGVVHHAPCPVAVVSHD
jgi:nucleotide-binding universal stress UspA family protein